MEAICCITKTKLKAIMQKRHCFAMNSKYLLCLLLLFIHRPQLWAQTADKGKIAGKITNEEGEALPGASIKVTGTLQTIFSDAGGNYSLNLPPGTYTLEVTFISYTLQKLTNIKVKPGVATSLNVSLQATAKDLDNV